jgi:hypothetical protein
MITTSFWPLDPAVLLDGLEPDGEDVDAVDGPYNYVAHHPVLVWVPSVRTRKSLGARALRTREREEHDHEEERELYLPVDRDFDGGDDCEDEA